MSHLLIVANVPSKNTNLLRNATYHGAVASSFPVIQRSPLEATVGDVLAAQGIIIGTTENFGYMSGQVKDFFERIYYPCFQDTQGLPWAMYISAGQDGVGALQSVERIVTGLKWKKTQEALIFKSPFKQAYIHQCEELGACMAMGLSSKIF
ncbi:MAG: flavodoxin family protein [Arenicella sp.]